MRSPHIAGIALLPLNLPLRQPFVTALGEKRLSENLLVAVRLSNGMTGYGEASASLAWPEETQAAMTQSLGQVVPALLGNPIRDSRRLSATGWKIAGGFPSAASALECALTDAHLRAAGWSLWKRTGGRRRSITTSLTISAWDPALAARVAQRAAHWGFQRLKVKVTGKEVDQDICRIMAVHRAAPRAALWVDANQGFTSAEAIRFCLFLRQCRLPVRLMEQPTPRKDWEGLKHVEETAGIPVVADESARTVEEARTLIRRKAVSVINVKLAKFGLSGSLEVIRRARSAGVRLMIGCMAESCLGLSHSVALACGTGAFQFVDLDSHLLVLSPRCRSGFSVRGPRLTVHPTRPGAGVDFPILTP